MTLAEAIYNLLPGAQYRGNVDASTQAQYEAIEWCDERPKPTWAEVEAYMAAHPDPVFYSPDRLILAIDALGKADELEAFLLSAPARTRLRWQKATVFDGNDPDFQGMVAAMQHHWQMTDEQRDALLAQAREI